MKSILSASFRYLASEESLDRYFKPRAFQCRATVRQIDPDSEVTVVEAPAAF